MEPRSARPIFVMVVALLIAASLACCGGTNGETEAGPASTQEAAASAPEETEAQPQPTEIEVQPQPTEPPSPQNTPTPEEAEVPAEPAEPLPATYCSEPLGLSRSNPCARSEVLAAPNWDVQVLEVVRGEQASVAVEAANMFNDPAPEGMEYLLVRVRAKCTYSDSEEHDISSSNFDLAGDQLQLYDARLLVVLEPHLDASLYAGEETEGWVVFLVAKGEGSLILILDDAGSSEDDRLRFIALDEGASIGVSPELAGIEPTDAGIDRDAPVPLGEMAITEDWEVSVVEVVRGEEAWTMIQAAAAFNEPPREGKEYVAVKVHLRYIGTEDEAVMMWGDAFESTGSANVQYDLPAFFAPAPQLGAELYPGGETEGWVTDQVAVGETDIMLVFEPFFELDGTNRRFLSLEP